MKYTIIDENGQYALILRGESMTQYAVVSGLDKKAGTGPAATMISASSLA